MAYPRLEFFRASQDYAWENKSDGPCKRCGIAHFRDRLWFCQKCGAVLCDSQVGESVLSDLGGSEGSSFIHTRVTNSKDKGMESGHLGLECGPVMKLNYEELKA